MLIAILSTTIPTLGSPIAVLRRPVAITRGLIANLVDPLGWLSAARPTTQALVRLAAHRALYNNCHVVRDCSSLSGSSPGRVRTEVVGDSAADRVA